MSIRPLMEEIEIAEAFNIFKDNVTTGGIPVECQIGYPGGSEDAMLVWHRDKRI